MQLAPLGNQKNDWNEGCSGPKRVIYLLMVDGEDLFLLFYRGKNDSIGVNASIKNPLFRKELHKYLALLEQDIREARSTSSISPNQWTGRVIKEKIMIRRKRS